MGERESALAEVARALDSRYGDPFGPLYQPPFRPLSNDSRFLALFAPPHDTIDIEADHAHGTGKLTEIESEPETGGSAKEWWKE